MLTIDRLAVAYRGVPALWETDLQIDKGEIFALIGPNGAGKSTLLNALCGIIPVQSGNVVFHGETLQARHAHRIARRGLIQVPEGRQVIAPLTVYENLELGRIAAGVRGRGRADLDYVHELFPVLAERRNQLAGSLSGGQQQMLAIGRALMSRPRMLLLDEPSLGLAPVIVKEVFEALLRLNCEGMTILLVEQNAKLALDTAHHAAILEQGRIVMRGRAAELANNPIVADHYFGGTRANSST